MTQSRKERNDSVIEEFRANAGKVGGQFAGMSLLLLTTTGAKSGEKRINPLAYVADGDRFLIFPANGGRPTAPGWYYNLLAHPEVVVEVGTERFNANATVFEGEERDRLYQKLATAYAPFADVQARTTRIIPVVALERV